VRHLKKRRTVLLVACAAALAAPVGCGGDDESAEDVAQEYVDARNDGDAAKVCELYSGQLKQQIAAGGDCAAFVREQSSGADTTFSLTRVDEDGDRATAVIQASTKEGGVGREQEIGIRLERQDGDWQITELVSGD